MSTGAGKGDTYRPVNRKAWDAGYSRIFRKPKPSRPARRNWRCPCCAKTAAEARRDYKRSVVRVPCYVCGDGGAVGRRKP